MIKERISLKLVKEIEKDVFVFAQAWNKEKNSESP